ncbi:hypothetical protein AB3S75_032680 [Citrus x aurantiifolia]
MANDICKMTSVKLGIVDFLLAADQDKGFYAFRIVTKRFHFGISWNCPLRCLVLVFVISPYPGHGPDCSRHRT